MRNFDGQGFLELDIYVCETSKVVKWIERLEKVAPLEPQYLRRKSSRALRRRDGEKGGLRGTEMR
jgi:hypothetical protein